MDLGSFSICRADFHRCWLARQAQEKPNPFHSVIMNKTIAVVVAAVCLGCSARDEGKSAATAGDTAAVPQTAADQNTCSAIAASDLTEALGGAVTRQESPTANRCVYYTANPVVYADIEIDRNGDAAWQGVNAGDSIIEAQQDSLTGIGDKAFFGPRDRLYIRKGKAFVAIEAGFDDKVRARARSIARVVTAKL